MSKAKQKPKHYLLTIGGLQQHAHAHGYLICVDKRQLDHAFGKMLDETEARALKPFPVLLATELTRGRELVRAIASARSPELKRLIETATDYHFSAWMMTADDPDDKRLMDLH